ncbi:MAG TPA: restriction endonuclease subunit S [Ignavibacteria bacterium]|nr:restriction endonuclease subunit S [Ignavibacteria bacterium]HMR41190.1 restriction endonuclease subunit S [Ignavibacteria bacterium]
MKNTSDKKSFYKSTIPNDWTSPEFGKVFSFIKSFSFSREHLTSERSTDEIRNIHYGDIHATYEDEILDFDLEERVPYLLDGFISKESFDDENFPSLKDGDLIIADASEDLEGLCDCIELRNIKGRKVLSGLHTFATRAENKKIAFGFRAYILRNGQVIRELRRIATGISVYSISKSNLEKVKIPLPPLHEQKAIARILSLMDTAISKNNSLIAKKELQKKWLMQNLLTGRKRLKGFEKRWDKLGAGKIFKSISIKGFENEELLSATQDKGIIPRTMLEGRVTMPNGTTAGYKLVEPGDFIISLRSFQGGLEYSYYRGIVSPAYIVLKPKMEINNEFYKQYYKSYEFIGRLATAVIGIRDGKQISYDDFCLVKIPYPLVDEQIAIGKILKAADKEIQFLKAKSEKLKEKKKWLMQVLLTGKLRLRKR